MSGRDDPRPRPTPAVPLHAVAPERSAAASRHMLPPSRRRWAPSAAQIARRRLAVRLAKWLLPLAGIGLLVALQVIPLGKDHAAKRIDNRGKIARWRMIEQP